MRSITHNPESRHIIFLGETGSGKSSVVNLLLEAGDTRVSNNSRTCTQVTSSACYETSLYCLNYCLWDTRGLSEGRSFFRNILGRGSVKDLENFLKERHRNREIDLLVYCVHGSRAFKALAKNYHNFCAISRRLAAPVAIVVTSLEKEQDTEDWWKRNASALRRFKMDFDDHACITTLPGPHLAESKEKLTNMIARNHHWEPKECGSYFGSPVQISTQSVPPHRHGGRMIWNHLKSWHTGIVDNRSLRADSSPSATTARCSDYNSFAYSASRSPTILPPTPRTATTSPNILRIDTSSVLADIPPLYSSEDTSSTGTSPCTVFYSCPTSRSEFFTDGNEGFLGDLHVEDLTETIRKRNNFATCSGAFGDVWECDLHSGGSSRKVAVKVLKTKPEELESYRKKFHRELRIWWRLQHRNAVPLLGVVSGYGRLPSPVSPWFSNGSLSSYLAVHDMLKASERRRLLRDIAAGLCYLHSQDIVHGDLHSGNVLIDDDGTACLTDFGLSLVDEFVKTSYLMSGICGNVVFADPALVKRAYDGWDIFYPTKPCDIYSFGGLILHVLSGRKPYDGIRSTSIFLAVLNGERPQIPANIVPQDVSVIQDCWDHEEGNRPSADSLAKIFEDQ